MKNHGKIRHTPEGPLDEEEAPRSRALAALILGSIAVWAAILGWAFW